MQELNKLSAVSTSNGADYTGHTGKYKARTKMISYTSGPFGRKDKCRGRQHLNAERLLVAVHLMLILACMWGTNVTPSSALINMLKFLAPVHLMKMCHILVGCEQWIFDP